MHSILEMKQQAQIKVMGLSVWEMEQEELLWADPKVTS